MRALLVVVACTGIAHAQPVRRQPLTWTALVVVPQRVDRGWFVGAGLTSARPTADVELGYQLTERAVVRARERGVARELEVAYAFGIGKLAVGGGVLRAKLFAAAAAGVTNDGAATLRGALSLRTHPVAGADWVTLELGVRAGGATEGFVAMAIVFEPLGRWVRTWF